MKGLSTWTKNKVTFQIEKRKHSRVPITINVSKLYINDQGVKNENNIRYPVAILVDISKTGVGLRLFHKVSLRDKLTFKIRLTSIIYNFECMVRVDRIAGSDTSRCIGASFINLTSEEERKLTEFVEREQYRLSQFMN